MLDVSATPTKPRQSRARVRQRRPAAGGRPGLWEGRFSVLDPQAPGGRRWISVYGATRAEAEGKLADAMAARGKGITPPRGTLTVATYLAGWLDQVVPDLKASTAVRYRGLLEWHVIPRIGGHRLRALPPGPV